RVPDNRERQASSRSDAIQKPAKERLPDCVGDAKCDYNLRVVGVSPMEFRFQKWSENGQCLPVNVVDDRGQEQQSADPPAQERYGAALDRRELVGKIHEKQLLAAVNERRLTRQAPGIIDWFSNS